MSIPEASVLDPDLMLLKPRADGYKEKLPTGEDILLLIEASDTSLQRDQEVKLPIYAQAGIPDYWIADLNKEVLLVHREPTGNQYRSIETLSKTGKIAPLASPEFSIELTRAFD